MLTKEKVLKEIKDISIVWKVYVTENKEKSVSKIFCICQSSETERILFGQNVRDKILSMLPESVQNMYRNSPIDFFTECMIEDSYTYMIDPVKLSNFTNFVNNLDSGIADLDKSLPKSYKSEIITIDRGQKLLEFRINKTSRNFSTLTKFNSSEINNIVEKNFVYRSLGVSFDYLINKIIISITHGEIMSSTSGKNHSLRINVGINLSRLQQTSEVQKFKELCFVKNENLGLPRILNSKFKEVMQNNVGCIDLAKTISDYVIEVPMKFSWQKKVKNSKTRNEPSDIDHEKTVKKMRTRQQ